MSNASALIGQMIMVWFPEHSAPEKPGPKFRPALVLEHSESKIRIAYCTSKHHDIRRRGEVILKDGEVENLKGDTKLCLGKTSWIPIRADFFSRNDKAFTVLGKFPATRGSDLVQAMEEVI